MQRCPSNGKPAYRTVEIASGYADAHRDNEGAAGTCKPCWSGYLIHAYGCDVCEGYHLGHFWPDKRKAAPPRTYETVTSKGAALGEFLTPEQRARLMALVSERDTESPERRTA